MQSWKAEALARGAAEQPAFPPVLQDGDDNPAPVENEISSDLRYLQEEFGLAL